MQKLFQLTIVVLLAVIAIALVNGERMSTMLSASAAPALGRLPEQAVPYQQFGSTNCGSTGLCSISFPAVTADTLISRVTCSIYLPATSSGVNAAGLGNTQGGAMYFPAILQSDAASYWVINAEVQMFFPSGQYPIAFVTYAPSGGPTPGSFSCGVSGYTEPGSSSGNGNGSQPPPPSVAQWRKVGNP